MKILLFGSGGQVGWELKRSLAPLGTLTSLDHSHIDLEDAVALERTILEKAPDLIVNAAAYTNVDGAESDAERAHRVNAQAPEIMAKAARELDAWLVHYSTDYVFDGTKTEAYLEEDTVIPLGAYGKTKAEGEAAILNQGCRSIILRTCWVYGMRGHNFPRTILRLANEKPELKIVADQFGTPTSAELIADVTGLIAYRVLTAQEDHGGIYHLTADGAASWYEFARYLVEGAARRGADLTVTHDKIAAIKTEEYPTPTKRPRNSVLSTQKITRQFGLQMPNWQVHADRFLDEVDFRRLS